MKSAILLVSLLVIALCVYEASCLNDAQSTRLKELREKYAKTRDSRMPPDFVDMPNRKERGDRAAPVGADNDADINGDAKERPSPPNENERRQEVLDRLKHLKERGAGGVADRLKDLRARRGERAPPTPA